MAEDLRRQFGVSTATALIIGQVIAVGIFLTPAGMAKGVQSPFWLFVIWIVVGLATLCGALSYSELSARYPKAGGPFVFLREAYGDGLAFLYGWVVLLVVDPGLTAIFGVGFASYFSFIVPMSPMAQTGIAILVVIAVGAVNMFGARVGASALTLLTLLKIGVLVFLVVFGFLGGYGDWNNFTPFFAEPPDWTGALIAGSVGAYFAFAGWWDVTRIAGEVENPQRTLPIALSAGVGLITVLYVLTSAVFIYLVPIADVKDDTTFAAQAGEALFGPAGGAVFAAIVVISVLGTLFAYLMSGPRVYFAMAREGLFFSAFGKPHEKFGTPYLAILVQIVLACVLIATGSFGQIISYFFMIAILFPAAAVLGLFWLRKKPHEGYTTPLFPIVPIIYVLITVGVSAMIFLQDPIQNLVGVGIVLIGIPVYLLIFRKR